MAAKRPDFLRLVAGLSAGYLVRAPKSAVTIVAGPPP